MPAPNRSAANGFPFPANIVEQEITDSTVQKDITWNSYAEPSCIFQQLFEMEFVFLSVVVQRLVQEKSHDVDKAVLRGEVHGLIPRRAMHNISIDTWVSQ